MLLKHLPRMQTVLGLVLRTQKQNSNLFLIIFIMVQTITQIMHCSLLYSFSGKSGLHWRLLQMISCLFQNISLLLDAQIRKPEIVYFLLVARHKLLNFVSSRLDISVFGCCWLCSSVTSKYLWFRTLEKVLKKFHGRKIHDMYVSWPQK